MRQLLQYETRKLFSSKSFWICGGLLVGMTLLELTFTKLLHVLGTQARASAPDNFDFPEAFFGIFTGKLYLVSNLRNVTPFLLSIIIALFVCFDFSQKTIRNVIARGYSRTNIFFSKLIVCMLATFIFSFVSVSCACAMGSLFWGFGGTVTMQLFITLVTQLLLIIALASGYLMMAILIRNPGIAIAGTILASFVISFVLSIFDAILAISGINIAISSYNLPTLLLSVSALDVSNNQLLIAAVCAVIWIIVLNGISVLTFCKRDV